MNSEIIVADSRIQIYSSDGAKLNEIIIEGNFVTYRWSEGSTDQWIFKIILFLISGEGFYGGISVDKMGILVATRTEKARHFIQVINGAGGMILNTIDSHNSRLCRPAGLMCTYDNHVVVVDLGNDAVKKYRYW